MTILRVTTVSNIAGTGPVSLTAQNTVKTSVVFDGDVAGSPAIDISANTSSITDHTVGQYTANITNAFALAHYAVSSFGHSSDSNYALSGGSGDPNTSSSYRMHNVRSGVGFIDVDQGNAIAVGDLL